MAIKPPPMTAQEFEEYVMLRENADRRLELIGGEVVELVSNQEASRLGVRIAHLINNYLDQNPIGLLTGSDGGYQVGNDRFMPDVGYMSKARQPLPSKETYNPLAPDLAIEVVSPSDEIDDVLAKVDSYTLAGTSVWVVYPKSKEIRVFTPGQPSKKLGIDDSLDGGEVLPGFTAKLQDIFAGE
jgi:Uma2 family endonuclease